MNGGRKSALVAALGGLALLAVFGVGGRESAASAVNAWMTPQQIAATGPRGSIAAAAMQTPTSAYVVYTTRAKTGRTMTLHLIRATSTGTHKTLATLSVDGTGEGLPVVAVNRSGDAVAAWGVRVGHGVGAAYREHIEVSRASPSSGWDAPHVASPTAQITEPSVAMSEDGEAALAFSSATGAMHVLLHSASPGSWVIGELLPFRRFSPDVTLRFDTSGQRLFVAAASQYQDVDFAIVGLDGTLEQYKALDSQGYQVKPDIEKTSTGALVAWLGSPRNSSNNTYVYPLKVANFDLTHGSPATVSTHTVTLVRRRSDAASSDVPVFHLAIDSTGTPQLVWSVVEYNALYAATLKAGQWLSARGRLPTAKPPLYLAEGFPTASGMFAVEASFPFCPPASRGGGCPMKLVVQKVSASAIGSAQSIVSEVAAVLRPVAVATDGRSGSVVVFEKEAPFTRTVTTPHFTLSVSFHG